MVPRSVVDNPDLSQLDLLTGQREGLQEMTEKLRASFPVDKVILYGSVARGTAQADSDTDVLVITTIPVSHKERGEMSGITFEIDMKYGTCISLVVVNHQDWYQGLLAYSGLRREIDRDGVVI